MALKLLGICTLAGAVLAGAAVPSLAAPALDPGLSKATGVTLVGRRGGGGGGFKGGGGGFKGGGHFKGGGGGFKAFKGGGGFKGFKGGGRNFSRRHGTPRFSARSYHGGRYARHHGRRHHRKFRGYAFYGVPYVYGWYGGYSCAWLRDRALLTDSSYWWQRYYDCVEGYDY